MRLELKPSGIEQREWISQKLLSDEVVVGRFECQGTEVIEWHDVEDGCQTYRSPSRSCRGRSGSGLQQNRGNSSSPQYRIIPETVEEDEARGTYIPPQLPKQSHGATNKKVRLMKVDIRVPKPEGGSRKVVQLVKIDIRSQLDADELGMSYLSSPTDAWPLKRGSKLSKKREIRGVETPDAGCYNTPNRDWASRIARLSNQQTNQEIQEILDAGSSPSGARAVDQRLQQAFGLEAASKNAAFGGSQNNVVPKRMWSDKQRWNRQFVKEPSDKPRNRSGGSRGWQPTHRISQETNVKPMSHSGAMRGLQSPNAHDKEENPERRASFSWAIRGLESPSRPPRETLKRAMSHSGALRGLQSPDDQEQETPERLLRHRWGIRKLESPNRTLQLQESFKRAVGHSGGSASRGLQSPNRPLQEIYDRTMSHSGTIRSLQSPNRTVQEIYELAMSHSATMRGLQSPNATVGEFPKRPVSQSGAVRGLQSPSRLQETYSRAMTHSGVLRALQSPNQETDARNISHSGAIRSLESPNQNLRVMYDRTMSHSGAIRSLESPNEREVYQSRFSPGWAVRGAQSPNENSIQETYVRSLSHSGTIRCLQSPDGRTSLAGYKHSSSQSPSELRPGSQGRLMRLPSPDVSHFTTRSGGLAPKKRSKLYRHRQGRSEEIKSAQR
ncbi:hypothetical protein R1sor_017133 [Riccia sorocarpa]|uniref:Uncharacterized protein n=1 Tax=Riccia sorocarpa TaxID=122646 RepID=A0ABD3I6E9_9MARC